MLSAPKTFVSVDAGGVNNFRTQETEKVAGVKPGSVSFSGSSVGNFSIRSIGPSAGTGGVMELPVKIMSTGFSTASSQSSKLHISSESDETLASTPFSGVPRRNFGSPDKNSSSTNEKAGTSVSISSYKQKAMTGAGSIGSSPAFPGSMLQSQKGFLSEPSKLHFTRETSEGTPLKQFHDVSFILDEMKGRVCLCVSCILYQHALFSSVSYSFIIIFGWSLKCILLSIMGSLLHDPFYSVSPFGVMGFVNFSTFSSKLVSSIFANIVLLIGYA